jgi:hypothetical protein
MKLHSICLLAAAAILASSAAAQPFVVTAQMGSSSSTVAPGGTLNVVAPAIGSPLPINLGVSYRGGSSANITGVSQTGSGDFTSTSVPTPLALTSGGSFSLTVTYKPSTGQSAQAQVFVSYLEGNATSPTTFGITINGTVPDLIYSYSFSGGSAQAVGDGALIQFPATPVSTVRSATFAITNRGSGNGTVTNIALTGQGQAFQLGGLQLPPFAVNAGASLSFTVAFNPTDRSTQTGILVITFAGKDYKFNLQGTGIAANYTYTVVNADHSTAVVEPGQAVSFPDTNLGASSTLTIIIANNGNGPGTITAISAVGTGFQSGNTVVLPATLAIGAQIQTTVTFAPTTPGSANGGLRIGDDAFSLTGTGIGPLLNYAYAIGGAANTVTAGGSVLFSPTKVGATGTLTFSIANAGNATAAINTIFLTGSSAFKLARLPNLPSNLDPGAGLTFDVQFAPTTTGVAQANLQIGNAVFPVSGSAAAPDPLPAATLNGPSGNIQPLQQPAYKLSLAAPYSIDLTGTLALSFSSAVFATDPSVQFASGGTTVSFTIPAGTTSALFLNKSDQIAIQTGTVAGAISLAARFATASGVDLTPSNAPNLTLTVPQLAPQITGVSLANQGASGFTLLVTGYATSRSVTQIQLQVTPAAGQTVTNSSITIPADSAFQSWYQTAASQSAGSSFTATLPVTLTGNSSAPSQLTKAIQSVSVTLVNAQGSSQSQTVPIP